MVNLQIAEIASVEAFETLVAELRYRGITTAVIVDEFRHSKASQACRRMYL